MEEDDLYGTDRNVLQSLLSINYCNFSICGGKKNNFLSTFLSSFGWANNYTTMRQVNRRRCPEFIMDVHSEKPGEYETRIHIRHVRFLCHSEQRSRRQGSRISKGKQAIVNKVSLVHTETMGRVRSPTNRLC